MLKTMSGLSALDLQSRVSKFEQDARRTADKERAKAEKKRVIQERVEAKRRAHEMAVAELRRRQAEEADKVSEFSPSTRSDQSSSSAVLRARPAPNPHPSGPGQGCRLRPRLWRVDRRGVSNDSLAPLGNIFGSTSYVPEALVSPHMMC
jgi:hypothetical protein